MSLRFSGVLVRPLDEQEDKDYHIDPDGVEFDPESPYPVSIEFNHSLIVGTATISREGGALLVSGLLYDTFQPVKQPLKAAIACMSTKDVWKATDPVIKHCQMVEVGLTRKHQDPNQPPLLFASDDEG